MKDADSQQKAKDAALGLKIGLQLGLDTREIKVYDLPESLVLALDNAIAAREKIPELTADMADLVADSENDIEKDARLYQIDLIAKQLNRAADLAQERKDYLSKIKTEGAARLEQSKCKANIEHFFKMYAWGFDPRPDSPLSIIPFELFEFQSDYVKWLNDLVFTKRASGVVEKARDMGATETALRWAIHNWMYKIGFSAILLSANEDLVDSQKNENTLFEKVRFQLRLLPWWLLPEGFSLKNDMPYMSVANKAMNSALHGYAPTANVGRQSRASVVIKDESAAWPFGGFPQHTALTSTSKSQIEISSVQGKNNKFADLCNDGVTEKFVMDWRQHPWKDERWYKSLPFGYISSAMTEQQIAQEIDRNFDASQPGKVFTDLKEEYCFITWDEMIEYYKQHKLHRGFYTPEGRLQIPVDWEWGRTFDYGQTDGHKWVYTVMARPPEGHPLSDSMFVFCCQPMPQNGTTEQQGVSQWRKWEADLGLFSGEVHQRPPQYSECSHEQKDLRTTLLQDYGESWTAWDITDYNGGISMMRQSFSRIDSHRPNPIRPQLMGRATVYFVAPRSEYILARNPQEDRWFVTPSTSQWGFKLLREELQELHYAPEERFKPATQQRPVKKKDDCCDALRGHFQHYGAVAKPLTERQKYDRRLKAMMPIPDGRPDFAPDITLQMNSLLLKRKLREEGAFANVSGDEGGYDADYDPGDLGSGW